MAISTKEIVDLLLESYCMELETVVNYLANSTNLDGGAGRGDQKVAGC